MRRLLLLLVLPLVASAQKFEEKVTVTYVEVPVTVLGRDGAPVRGLTKANFELRDNGEKRAIESFDAVDFASEGGAGAKVISPLNPASRRNFLLLFDLSYSNPQTISRAQAAARDFVARSIGRRDAVAVGVVDIDHGFRFLTAFTTDRALLTAAIAEPRNFRAADPLQIASSSSLVVEPQQAMGSTQQGQDIALENMRDVARLSGRVNDSYKRGRLKKQVALLGDIAETLQRLAGRKHLVLLSEGFDPRLVQGRSAGTTENQAEEDQAVERGEMWKVDSDQRFGSPDTQTAIQMMSEAFRRADVVLHAVDIQGVRVANDAKSGAKFNSNEGLFILANSTGGTVFRNSNDITSEFDRLARQHDVVYVLGFRAPVGRAGEFHDLKVKLVNVPAARVQHRGGYYDAGAESLLERSLSTAEVIVNDIPQEDLGLHALAAAFPGGRVPVVLEISGPDLVKHARNNRATTDLFLYAFDEQGIVRDSLFQRVTLDTAQAGAQLSGSGVRFYGTLQLPPGRYALKSLVRVSESDRKGFQRIELDVPAEGDVSMVRPLFFADAGNWVMVKATRDDPKAPYPFMLGEDAFIPAARATLRKGEPRLFTVFVYNAVADELTWDIAPQAKLVRADNAGDVTKFVFALEQVPPDARELAVTIRKKGSADARTVTVPIEIR
ncbi:MAG TPA: VWA domain-containing protein [Thermoanaerobaculia bacterium]|nr:VWA domain-containing protein [Thermoanaerobaculia bacterium]